jgi:hypothetical protein
MSIKKLKNLRKKHNTQNALDEILFVDRERPFCVYKDLHKTKVSITKVTIYIAIMLMVSISIFVYIF